MSTVDTTESDRKKAARVVNVPADIPRYSGLPSLDTPNIDEIMLSKAQNMRKKVAAVSKQVDPSWLERKQHGGPTQRDLEVLRRPDPTVHLNLSYGSSSASSTSTGSDTTGLGVIGLGDVSTAGNTYGGIITGGTGSTVTHGGIRSSIDPVTLMPRFSMDVSADDVFGSLNALSSWGDTLSRQRRDTQRVKTILKTTATSLS